jgi:hypothetical protein
MDAHAGTRQNMANGDEKKVPKGKASDSCVVKLWPTLGTVWNGGNLHMKRKVKCITLNIRHKRERKTY